MFSHLDETFDSTYVSVTDLCNNVSPSPKTSLASGDHNIASKYHGYSKAEYLETTGILHSHFARRRLAFQITGTPMIVKSSQANRHVEVKNTSLPIQRRPIWRPLRYALRELCQDHILRWFNTEIC